MIDTLSIIALVTLGAVRLARAFSSGPPSRLLTEAERVLHQQHGVRPWPIAELPEGQQGRLVGNVRELQRTLTAPLTGRACVYYVILVEESVSSGWRERITERHGVAFGLEDASGCAVIEPARASVALAFYHREEIRAPGEATPAQDTVLARHGYNIAGGGRLRFVEAVLSVGERVTVVGTGMRRPYLASPAELDYRSAMPTRLHVAASDAAPLSISSHRIR